jgi:murein DD-endopeptidase MepM/ murein hydrolase activator NlpD
VYTKALIALLTFCAGSFVELSAQNISITARNEIPVISDQPGIIGNDIAGTSIPETESDDIQLSVIELKIPQPYKDFQIDLLAKKDLLPPYYSIEGIYKIDCVYIKGFDYYDLWETNKLNPYGFNGEHFSDNIEIQLFGNDRIGSWHPPLDQTIITSDFGLRRAVWHFGVDIRVKTGNPVYAVFDGVVRVTGYDRRGFGRFVLIRHKNGFETLYGHLSDNFMVLGQEVKAGDIIGKGGNSGRSTAPHLHFEIRYSGNAINPNKLFDFDKNTILDSKYTINHDSFAYLEEANKIRYHIIRSGDTLSGLSYRYGVSINKMCSLNGISRNSILRIGQRVRIN